MCIERYWSLAREGVILSHSLWRNEASIARWRTEHGECFESVTEINSSLLIAEVASE